MRVLHAPGSQRFDNPAIDRRLHTGLLPALGCGCRANCVADPSGLADFPALGACWAVLACCHSTPSCLSCSLQRGSMQMTRVARPLASPKGRPTPPQGW